jgi:hypothetical protein
MRSRRRSNVGVMVVVVVIVLVLSAAVRNNSCGLGVEGTLESLAKALRESLYRRLALAVSL